MSITNQQIPITNSPSPGASRPGFHADSHSARTQTQPPTGHRPGATQSGAAHLPAGAGSSAAASQAGAVAAASIGDMKSPVFAAPKVPIDDLLRTMLAAGEGVSDLFFIAGRPPQVENFGKLVPVERTPFSAGFEPLHTEGLARSIVGEQQRLLDDLRANGSCDCSYAVGDLARFRVNVFKQKGTFAMVLRKLNTKIPTTADLKLPPVFKRIAQEKTGLVFVTGATGSGKTTTLAAMLNELNESHAMHIVTLEDPVEFLHPHKMSTFCQREMGRDFSSFAMGLRAALRQAPKVILVGEIRDRETMEIALTAAETGHVVYSTLHTISAAQSINRVLGMFSKEEEDQVRERLAETLRWVVSQRLAPKIGGGRIMIPEIMGSNMRSKEAVQLGESEVRNLYDVITQASPEGWCTFEQSLCAAFERKEIDEESAMLLSVNKSRMRQMMDRLKKKLGQDDAGAHGLKLVEEDEPAPKPAPSAAASKPAEAPKDLKLKG